MNSEGTVKLISSDGMEFVVSREAAMLSTTLRSMLTSSGNFIEAQQGVVTFPDISGVVLKEVCKYLYWSLSFSRGETTKDFPIKPEIALQLMRAADYLDV